MPGSPDFKYLRAPSGRMFRFGSFLALSQKTSSTCNEIEEAVTASGSIARAGGCQRGHINMSPQRAAEQHRLLALALLLVLRKDGSGERLGLRDRRLLFATENF